MSVGEKIELTGMTVESRRSLCWLCYRGKVATNAPQREFETGRLSAND
jgi:hypothetical protein